MPSTSVRPSPDWLQRVSAMIHSGDSGPVAVARHLPPRSHPDFGEILGRLVRTDLRRKAGDARSSAYAEYRSLYPELPADDDAESHGTDVTQTPAPGGMLCLTQATRIMPVEIVGEPPVAFPRPGQMLGGFKLLDELGRGAFGRVYLASEAKLANRLVALKLTRKPTNESLRLARLQHTNIVPIHTAFTHDGWNVVQMPFFGRQTLAELLDSVKAAATFPKSGEVFASTQMRLSTQRKTVDSQSLTVAAPMTPDPDSDIIPIPVPALDTGEERQPSREMLVGLTYTDAAVWIISRLADGLAHAHAKDILHLDLKPHNILLSDDGQPMLLDFNLAFDRSTMDRDRVGGTWPYMAPEQICEYARRPGSPVDERSDLYSLGVMFFELLTTHHPFDTVVTTDDGLTKAVDARRAGARDVPAYNPDVPSSIAAVVAKLLAPSPIDRYQSADQLREDLRRHSDNRPLAHARDRSVKERVVKWHRRHPKASLVTCVAVLLLGLFFTAAQMMAWSQDRQRNAAQEQARSFLADLARLRLDLSTVHEPAKRTSGLREANDWLKKYRVGQPTWTDDPEIRLLSQAEHDAVRSGLGELALLGAHAHMLNARKAAPSEKAGELSAAKDLNAKAAAGFETVVKLVDVQKTEIEGAGIITSAAVGDTSAELFVQSVREIAEQRAEHAVKLLTKLVHRQTDHFAGQFALASSLEMSHQLAQAVERYQVAKPLLPSDARPAFHRGKLLNHLQRYAEAEAEFTECIDREPGRAGAHLYRGLARRNRGESEKAVEDFTAELALNNDLRVITLAMRAQSYSFLGHGDLFKQDAAALDAAHPTTDLEYVARAVRWYKDEPARALADYHQALKLNSNCVSALQNAAALYSNHFDQQELALGLLSQAAKLHPALAQIRSGHAVVLARLGNRTEAHREISAALLLGKSPLILYQAACVFALTSDDGNKDQEQALVYFRQSLGSGFRDFDEIYKDKDIRSIRGTDEFNRILAAALELGK